MRDKRITERNDRI